MKRWQQKLQRQAKPALKHTGKFILLGAAAYGPAALSGWAVKSVARKPVKILLAWALEPVIRKVMKKAVSRWSKPER